jgi:hypothetical protein
MNLTAAWWQQPHTCASPKATLATVSRIDPKTRAVQRTELIGQIIRTIERDQIDVVVVDPFVETFEGDENSNMDVKAVGVIWREVARRTGCSVLLVHHTKKYATGMTGDADAARGASSLVNLCRIAVTLFTMSADEAKANGLETEERTKFVRFDDAKANMTLATGRARWFEKVTVTLPNGAMGVAGDEVGVLSPWKPPGAFAGADTRSLNVALDMISRGLCDDNGAPTGERFTKSSTNNSKRWAGNPIMQATGLAEDQAKGVIKAWLESKLLTEDEYQTANGDKRKGLWVDDSKRPEAQP